MNRLSRLSRRVGIRMDQEFARCFATSVNKQPMCRSALQKGLWKRFGWTVIPGNPALRCDGVGLLGPSARQVRPGGQRFHRRSPLRHADQCQLRARHLVRDRLGMLSPEPPGDAAARRTACREVRLKTVERHTGCDKVDRGSTQGGPMVPRRDSHG